MFDLAEIIRQHEGKTLEFKRDLSSPDKVMRTLVAFANGAGGKLLIGVEDGSRKVLGVPDTGGTEEQLANFISDRIEPRRARSRSLPQPKPASFRQVGGVPGRCLCPCRLDEPSG